MPVIDRYILSEWLKIFGLVLAATLGLLLLEDMSDTFRELLDFGAAPEQILRYYLILIPSFLPVVLPISVLLSVLYSMGRLHRNNEFIAMRSAGLNILRISRSLWSAGLLLSVLSWVLNASVIPWSVEASRAIRDNVEFAHQAAHADPAEVGMVRAVAYDNQVEDRMWFINRFSQYTFRAFGVSVSELDADRHEMRRILAEEAYFDDHAEQWVFLRGREMWLAPETGDIQRARPFSEETFQGLTDDPRLMLMLRKRPKDLSFAELRVIVGLFRLEDNPNVTTYAVRLHSMMAGTLASLIVIGIAVPFAVSGVRVSPAVGVSKSLGLFFAYYLLSNFSLLLAERGLLSPLIAAWVPNLFMLGFALWLFRRLV